MKMHLKTFEHPRIPFVSENLPSPGQCPLSSGILLLHKMLQEWCTCGLVEKGKTYKQKVVSLSLSPVSTIVLCSWARHSYLLLPIIIIISFKNKCPEQTMCKHTAGQKKNGNCHDASANCRALMLHDTPSIALV